MQINLPPSAFGRWNSIRKASADVGYEDKYQNVLFHQEKRLQDAWNSVLFAFPDTDWDIFSYHWLILNTRRCYCSPEDWNDAIALVPFADYLNHAGNAIS